MKKSVLLLALIAISLSSWAQSVSFGIKAGLNLSKLTASADGGSISTESLAGFHVGAVVDFGSQNFSFQPGILFSTKGGKSTSSGSTSKTTLNYIEVPVNFLYKAPAGDGKLFFGGGPYLGLGISGKDSGDDGEGNQISESVHFGSAEEDYKNPDFGINFIGGYQFNTGLSISAGYGLGLANLYNGGEGLKLKNQVLSFSLGYFFK